jgi:hypothetical protein
MLRVTNVEKPLTLSQSIENLQHSEISFDGKIKEFKAKYQYIFWQF